MTIASWWESHQGLTAELNTTAGDNFAGPLTPDQAAELNTLHGDIIAMADPMGIGEILTDGLTAEQVTALNTALDRNPIVSLDAELQTSRPTGVGRDNATQSELDTVHGAIRAMALTAEQATALQAMVECPPWGSPLSRSPRSARMAPRGSPPSKPPRCKDISSQCDPFRGLLKREGSEGIKCPRDLTGFAPAFRQRIESSPTNSNPYLPAVEQVEAVTRPPDAQQQRWPSGLHSRGGSPLPSTSLAY